MNFKLQRCLTVLSVALLVLVGCGRSDRPPMATASGIVKLDGVPVEGATVTFIPVEGGRPGSGRTDAEGRYTIKTFEDVDGGIVGDHKVSVMKISGDGAYALEGAAPPSNDASGEDDGSDGLSQIGAPGTSEKNMEPIYDVPQRYMNSEESGLTLTIPPEGSEELDIELTR